MVNFFKRVHNMFAVSDKVIWSLLSAILLYSLLLIKSASRTSGETFYRSQLLALVLGLAVMVFAVFFDYESLIENWKFTSALCVFLMVFSLIFGINIKGISGVNARAWIKIPNGPTFQPSELAKIGFILTFSKHLHFLKSKNILDKPINLVCLLGHVLVPVLLTHFQGDDGAAVIFIFIFIFMAFISGIKMRYFLYLVTIFTLSVPLLWKYVLMPYQKNRIINQLNPENDPLGVGFQQIQAKLSIGSGGFFGKGIFKGDRVFDRVVPVQESDFILSVAGEELGFAGCFLIIVLISCLVCRIFYITKNCAKISGIYICFGIISLIVSQTIFNIGMCLSLLPTVGVTLPFFSAGGSSLFCLLLSMGIIQNIYIKSNNP
ncbi:MAG: FtsW/RodA/SpoVE family cell cycle protein [Candidatus Improbicoccus pseudotrichonymphae]|uniref:FtsW/RodA/SpoVE family cell cycle protein n=1 Tax=Candidatus Improbicoccus pseudotrichonymphae TaxID=3033792 RepID=A0AA48HUE2_9FIRM|nr:MAG: FtsW/RodA/SpoVE family cell cycle protein [Candidatus Improbicoccus pseudotrichonymphae]